MTSHNSEEGTRMKTPEEIAEGISAECALICGIKSATLAVHIAQAITLERARIEALQRYAAQKVEAYADNGFRSIHIESDQTLVRVCPGETWDMGFYARQALKDLGVE